MRVKALREHSNSYGLAANGKPTKAKGDEYDLPDAAARHLIDAGLVEEVKTKAEAAGKAAKAAD